MDIFRLDHANLRTARLDEMIEWYGRVLHMFPGDRPNFSFGGAWLYRHGQALVHIVQVEEPGSTENLALEHFALQARGLKDFLSHTKANNVETRVGKLPEFGIVQVNIWDPDGNHIHVDFHGEDVES